MYPLRFAPIFQYRLWGGRRLADVFDGPVPGPWGRYADVWRVVYAPPSDRFLGMEENYFLW